MTDPTPQTVCRHCGRPGRMTHSGMMKHAEPTKGHRYEPAEPSPAPQTQAPSMPTTSGETPEVMTREEMAGLISKLHHKLAHPNERIRELESALTSARAERHLCPECDRTMSLLSNGPREYKHICEFCEILEENDSLMKERDRAQKVLRTIVASDDVWEMLEIARAALKPVSDRQPEGETK